MSRQAQAERTPGGVILANRKSRLPPALLKPQRPIKYNPTALHLRAMNMLFEGLKEKGAMVIVPSSAVDTMNLGGISGITALAQNEIAKPKE